MIQIKRNIEYHNFWILENKFLEIFWTSSRKLHLSLKTFKSQIKASLLASILISMDAWEYIRSAKVFVVRIYIRSGL